MAVAVPTKGELTESEKCQLTNLEGRIKSGLKTFIEVGLALTEIRDSKLYRASHKTFEAYVKERFDMSRSRAYQLIRASDLSTTVDINNEHEARTILAGQGTPKVKPGAKVSNLVEDLPVIEGGARVIAEEWGRERVELPASTVHIARKTYSVDEMVAALDDFPFDTVNDSLPDDIDEADLATLATAFERFGKKATAQARYFRQLIKIHEKATAA